MRIYLVFIFFTFINPVWGNTKTSEPTSAKEIKSTVNKSSSEKKKAEKKSQPLKKK